MEISGKFTGKLCKIHPTCSKRDPFCMNTIYICNTKPTTFGRTASEEVHVSLMSKNTPLMISRKHATISPSTNTAGNNCFVILDHNSLNGISVNGKRLKANVHHELKHGDRVTFGCGVNGQRAEFQYIFEHVINNKDNDSKTFTFNPSPTKRKKTINPEFSLGNKELQSSDHIREKEEKILILSKELKSKESEQQELLNKLHETETELLAKLERERASLEKSYNKAENELKDLLAKQLSETKAKYEVQLETMKSEKSKIEKTLTDALSHKLSEAEEKHKEDLLLQQKALEERMISKERELMRKLDAQKNVIEQYKTVEENQKELETCLLELRKEIQEKESQLKKQEETVKKVENQAKQDVIGTMEEEFSCIICQELFVHSTTLPCAHTFCELCLKLWLRKKKNCPVCRCVIKGKAVRSLVLDSAVEKMIETMGPEEQERRKKLLKERAVQKQKEESSEDPTNIRDLFYERMGGDDDSNIAGDSGNDSRNQQRPRNNNRRRSRSRSPRHFHHRHQPYEVGRHHHHQSTVNNYNDFRPLFNSYSNDYYNQRQRYMDFNDRNARYNNSTVRCFRCGGIDHIARHCYQR